MERISVAIRVRPPVKQEIFRGSHWKIGEKTIALHNALGCPVLGQSYTFDHVFARDATNENVYEIHTKRVILSALEGFNGTVFAYGQTSSGKTYTMRGSDRDAGVIHRAVCDVFGNIQNRLDREYLIRVSYMEIYREEINDLLAPENRKLRVHENSVRGIFVAGLREEIVNSPDQVFEFLEFGEANRHFGKTNMNIYSSRSHTIFRMVIESRDKTKENDDGFEAVRISTLNMVDLAGSERIAKTGAGGVRLKEGTHINKSLMTLGTVISKLSEANGKQGGHIPYRNSKLTRILQSALDGNAKTAVICTVTPDEMQLDETRGTLQFASRAKKVSTCAQVNETMSDAALLKRQKKEIEELRKKLQGARSEDLEKEILNLRNELLKFELERERLTLELEEEKKAQKERESRIKEQERKIENLSTLVISSALDDRKQSRKSNRRETWCPQWESSKSAVKVSSSRSEADTRSLVSVRGNTDVTPVKFQMLLDNSDGNVSIEEDVQAEVVISVPPDFENIADEETWISMNKGFSGFSSAERPSVSSTSSTDGEVSKDTESECEELRRCLLSKTEELELARLHLQELMADKKEYELRDLRFRKQVKEFLGALQGEISNGKRDIQALKEVVEDYRASFKSSVQGLEEATGRLKSGRSTLINSKEAEQESPQGLKSLTNQEQQRGSPWQRGKSSSGSGRKAALYARLLELEANEKHLSQILQQSMAQLLEVQNVNKLLSAENSLLAGSNSELDSMVKAMTVELNALRSSS